MLTSRLRSVLGAERIERTDAGYKLTLDWLDLDALGEYATEAEHRLAQDAVVAARTAAAAGVALARGRPLADEPDPWWAAPESALAEQWVRRLRQVLLATCLRCSDFMEAEHQARALLAPDPYDEVALRALMTALARSGRTASALSAYAQFRALLAEELGVSPEESTEEIHRAILLGNLTTEAAEAAHGADGRGAGSRPDLPGRTVALGQLDVLFADSSRGRCILCVVEGEAGIGKTRLLRTWATGLVGLPVSVASVTCDELGQALPLQPVLDLVAALAQSPGTDSADALLGPDAPVLGPLLGLAAETPTTSTSLTEADTGQGILHGALTRAVRRAALRQPVVLLVDDAHLADPATLRWLSQAPAHMGDAPLLIVVSARLEEDLRLPGATQTLALDPLDLEAASAIVGPERADELLARSGGNALLLTELAAWEPAGANGTTELPHSIRSTVEERCARAGEAGTTLRTAAVIGRDVDLDVLAAVTGAAPSQLLGHLEEGVRRRFLVEEGPGFAFGHTLVREALASTVGAARTAFIHREAARALVGRRGADPLAVASHARLGGDVDTAAAMLMAAARIAVTRFDAAQAVPLLDEAIALHDTAAARVERARVLTMLDRHDEAAEDLDSARALGAGPEILEVAAWSSHFRRRFAEALLLADQGARDADSFVLGPLLPPRQVVAGLPERLLPAELDHAAEQLESDGVVPPIRRRTPHRSSAARYDSSTASLGSGRSAALSPGTTTGPPMGRPRPASLRSRAERSGHPAGGPGWRPSNHRGPACAAPRRASTSGAGSARRGRTIPARAGDTPGSRCQPSAMARGTTASLPRAARGKAPRGRWAGTPDRPGRTETEDRLPWPRPSTRHLPHPTRPAPSSGAGSRSSVSPAATSVA